MTNTDFEVEDDVLLEVDTSLDDLKFFKRKVVSPINQCWIGEGGCGCDDEGHCGCEDACSCEDNCGCEDVCSCDDESLCTTDD